MIEHQKLLNDEQIAVALQGSKAGRAELKKPLVKTLVRRGHTRERARQIVKENFGK